ncbi:HNH endonuclease [Sinirhodobacter populi]|uniref:Putative HNH nuclease YajD n=1 Tax=Paenirhodobacter populi TaxID=2306993 RepID=A0A443K9P5_9RHOB|nr:HNH endonuclease [Sinirhodobacter populi]RWR29465.1 HNH endonuclease [Sinirhodobacter populi]
MPTRAPHICGCGKRVPSGGRCPCQQQRDAERKARFDKVRPNSSQRGYTGAWEKASKAFLKRRPVCAMCGKTLDLETPRAAVVDHIRAHKGDRDLFWDKTNWQRLCRPCHSSRKQRLERRNSQKDQQ